MNLQVTVGLFHLFLQMELGLGAEDMRSLSVQPWSRDQRACWMPVDRGSVQGAGRRAGAHRLGQRQCVKKQLGQGDRCQGCV